MYGGTTDENIQLNEETFWSGGPHNNNSKKSLENLPKVRELIFNGREEEGGGSINQTFIPWSSWYALPADGKSAYQA